MQKIPDIEWSNLKLKNTNIKQITKIKILNFKYFDIQKLRDLAGVVAGGFVCESQIEDYLIFFQDFVRI